MNSMQLVKRRFFAMRNGIIADAIRRSGAPYRMIFGLNLPQIKEIAADFAPDSELARALRDDRSTRESQMLAPMLLSVDDVTADEATEWITNAPTAEAVDILCHALLRHHPEAAAIVDRCLESEEPMSRYGAMRLMWNIFRNDPPRYRALAAAELERNNPASASLASASLAQSLLDEIDFLFPA